MTDFPTMSDIDWISYDDLTYLCPETFDFGILTGAFLILIFIFGVICNVLLFLVLVVYENLKNIKNIFLLNLACSDLIFITTLPFFSIYLLHHWIFGDFACKFTILAFYVGVYSSVILLTAMTVDRFITVVLHNRPSNPVRRHRCGVVACTAAWVISISAGLRETVRVKVEAEWDNSSICEFNLDDPTVSLGYHLQVALLFFLPFVIIAFCYAAILRTVLQASNRRQHKTLVMVLCIVAAFFICWGPYHGLLFIRGFYKPEGCEANQSFHIADAVCTILAASHCCMNPLLCLLSQNLRGSLLQLLPCNRARSRNSGNASSISVTHNVTFTAHNYVPKADLESIGELSAHS